MKMVLINGSLREIHSDFDLKLNEFRKILSENSTVSNIDYYTVKDMDIRQCIGCFGCWVKSPGKCVLKDDMEKILESVINSDLVIFSSPLVMGMTTGLMKRVQDRFLPLIHPYMTLVGGEVHHKKRYKSYPYIGVIYQQSPEDNSEDIELCHELYKRFAVNFYSHVKFFNSVDDIREGDVL